MSIIREFTLYLHAGITTPEVIHANQYSQGETWIFKLLQDDGSVYVPSTGALIGVKADGHAIAGLTGTVLGDGRVSITTTQQLTAAAGDATCELTIDGGTNGSANFVIRVEKKPTDDAILSESDLSIIQQGLNSVTPAAINESVSNYLEENLTDPPIDPTLSISNAAADAKVTGDKITDLKTEINNSDLALVGRENLINGISWIDNKYIKGDGTIGDNTSYHMTDKIYLPSSALYTMLYVSNGGYFRVCAYNSDDTVNSLLINGSSASSDKRTATFTFPATASYVRISMQKTGGAYAVILGVSVDNEIGTLNSTVNTLKKVSLNCTTPMVFNTSNNTLTLPRYTYVFVENVRYSFESSDIVLDYSGISGNGVAVVLENGNLAVKAYNSVGQNPVLFRFTKNTLTRPQTNDIFYPYYVNGILYNTNTFESILYVDGVNGSDSNSGGSSSPFATIQKAIDNNPTMIYVARGTYNETLTILNNSKLKILPWATPTFSTSVFDVPMITVNGVDCRASRQIEFVDVYANNPGAGKSAWYIDNVIDAVFDHCWASDADTGGFQTTNLYGKFLQCKAWNIGNSTYYNSDGFNLHGYGVTEFIDCVAHDCYDDGISHHDGCVCSIKGGEYYNCSHGGGIAPVNRYCEVDGAYCHDNLYGIESMQSDASLYDPYILVKNSVLKNNGNYDIRCGDIPMKVLRCTFDTKSIGSNAEYVEIG